MNHKMYQSKSISGDWKDKCIFFQLTHWWWCQKMIIHAMNHISYNYKGNIFHGWLILNWFWCSGLKQRIKICHWSRVLWSPHFMHIYGFHPNSSRTMRERWAEMGQNGSGKQNGQIQGWLIFRSSASASSNLRVDIKKILMPWVLWIKNGGRKSSHSLARKQQDWRNFGTSRAVPTVPFALG